MYRQERSSTSIAPSVFYLKLDAPTTTRTSVWRTVRVRNATRSHIASVQLLRHGMGNCLHWGAGHNRAQRFIHAGVTVIAAPSGITSTESMLPQHSVLHEFGGAKRDRHLDRVSATSIRTAEVTICIISQRLLHRPRQLPKTKKRHSEMKLALLISSQAKVHSQPRWVVAIPNGRRTSFV